MNADRFGCIGRLPLHPLGQVTVFKSTPIGGPLSGSPAGVLLDNRIPEGSCVIGNLTRPAERSVFICVDLRLIAFLVGSR